MLRKFFALTALITILNLIAAIYTADFVKATPVAKENPNSVIDTLQLLKPDEVSRLARRIKAVEDTYNVRIGIEFLKNTHGQSVETTANSLLDKNFSGGANGGILLLVVMDTRKWYISTDLRMRDRIFDTNAIAATFLEELSAGNYFNACSNYIDGVEKSLAYYEQNGAAYDSSDEFDVFALMIAVVVAIICGFMFRSMLIGSMSNVRPAVEAGEYLDRNSVDINEKKDRYLFTNTSRRRKGKSGSGGGSSSGGSGGGGSHGGGGGSF